MVKRVGTVYAPRREPGAADRGLGTGGGDGLRHRCVRPRARPPAHGRALCRDGCNCSRRAGLSEAARVRTVAAMAPLIPFAAEGGELPPPKMRVYSAKFLIGELRP